MDDYRTVVISRQKDAISFFLSCFNDVVNERLGWPLVKLLQIINGSKSSAFYGTTVNRQTRNCPNVTLMKTLSKNKTSHSHMMQMDGSSSTSMSTITIQSKPAKQLINIVETRWSMMRWPSLNFSSWLVDSIWQYSRPKLTSLDWTLIVHRGRWHHPSFRVLRVC